MPENSIPAKGNVDPSYRQPRNSVSARDVAGRAQQLSQFLSWLSYLRKVRADTHMGRVENEEVAWLSWSTGSAGCSCESFGGLLHAGQMASRSKSEDNRSSVSSKRFSGI